MIVDLEVHAGIGDHAITAVTHPALHDFMVDTEIHQPERDRLGLFGEQVQLFTHGTGTGNIKAAVQGALMGTHIRVGQEDNLFDVGRRPFKSNAEQVEKVKRILAEFGLEFATPTEARAILGLEAA